MSKMIVSLTLLFLSCVSSALVRMEPSVNTFSSSKWIRESSNGDAVIKAVFVLKHDSDAMKKFEFNLLDTSNPKSSNYGKWLTIDQISSMISPSEKNVQLVVDYIKSHGVPDDRIRVSKLRDMVHVEMAVSVANRVLNTEFALFRSNIRRKVVLGRITKPYYLPAEIANVVSLVDDILRFPSIRTPLLSFGSEDTAGSTDPFSSCGATCSGYTTPDVLQQAYSIPTTTKTSAGNTVSVAEFQYQYYDNTDLSGFSSACGVKVDVDTTIGGNNPTICTALGGCVEALLDIEYIGALTSPIPLTVIYSASYSLLDWVDQVISLANPPLVHSVSYGNDEVQQTSTEYMISVNEQFQVAGSLGLSILFASGDQGVWGRSGVGKTFNPDFPAASPYVTAVGGTNFATKSTIGEESAWSCGGGGFSDTFAQPAWQSDVVNAYLSKAALAGVLPAATLYNSTGRAYPDVAALGGQTNPYCVAYSGGKFAGVAGTSASCPVVASVFAQLNNVRLAAGKSSLGWLNPLIYSNSQCFNDVSDGSQNNCNAGTTGFAALAGWDPATGFGSPNYACLAKVV
eukprot:gene14206-19060_t